MSYSHRAGGFTRTELIVVVVVLAVIASLVAVVIPVASAARLEAQTDTLLHNARSIWLASFMWGNSEDVYVPRARFHPVKGPLNVEYNRYPDSTEYFRALVTERVFAVSFDLLSAPGIPSATDAESFGEQNNAWSITANTYDGTDEETPYLMLRNLETDNLSQPVWDGSALRIGSGRDDPRHQQPFGPKAFVFVTQGGAGFALSGYRMKPAVVTNLFLLRTNDFPILHPW